MIRIADLCLWHDDDQILDNIGFEVAMGETLAIIGESGGGKTSLARLLLGLLGGRHMGASRQGRGFRWTGRAEVGGIDVLRAGRSEMARFRGRMAGMIVQALSDALNPHMKVREHVEEMLASHGMHHIDAEAARGAWNIPQRIWERYPAGLSGGEIQRVLTALAMLPAPRYLVLDEPTASLDNANREKAMQAFTRGRDSRCQVLITHDLDLVDRLADRVVVLRQGHIVEIDAARKILDAPSERYTERLIAAARDVAAPPRSEKAGSAGLRESTISTPPGLHVSDLCHGYGKANVLDALSFHLPKGDCLAVLGESGAGKSTLARLLCGYERARSGHIAWIGDDRRPAPPRAALISQHPHRAMPSHFTVAQVLREALTLAERHAMDATGGKQRIGELLELVGLPTQEDFLERPSAVLSGGEAQRLVIARALAGRPNYLVADEPTAALDMLSRSTVLKLLKRLQDEQALTIVLITHEPEIAGYMSRYQIQL